MSVGGAAGARADPSPLISGRYAPAYKRHGQDVSVLHFIGAEKPWRRGTRDAYVPDAAAKDYYGLVQQWFDVFVRHYGSVSTYDVASKVVAPPSYVRRAPASLPKLADLPPKTASASSTAPSTIPTPTTPTLVLSPPSPLRAPSASTSSSSLPPPIPIVGAGANKRAPSPPKLAWDASRSSPPRDGQFQMQAEIPYSTNVWDLASKRQQKERFEPPASYPPPPSETHDWYRDILRQKPDPSKVKAVFPWEESATRPSTPAAVPDRPPPPPTRTFSNESAGSAAPGSFGRTGIGAFTNAWDAVPGIQRYAQSLVKTGPNRKGANPGAAPARGGSGNSSGGNGSSSASGGNHAGDGRLASRGGHGGDRHRQHHHRRKSSGGSASGSTAAAFGLTPSGSTSVTSPRVSHSAARPTSSAGAFPSRKEGDASSRDGDDEEDEDADVSTTTDDAQEEDEEEDDDAKASSNPATSSERDSDEGIDKIAIRFRRAAASHPDWAREITRAGDHRGGHGSTDESDDAATLRSAPTSPGRTRRPEPRFVPTSPRQPRSPHLSTSPHLTLPSSLTRPSLHLHASHSSGSSTSVPHPPRSPISPRLAAQAIRNSTAARLIASGSGSGDAPPVVRATRVFRPETDTSNVKQQGLAALQRFVENMEASVSSNQNSPPPGTGGGGGGEFRP